VVVRAPSARGDFRSVLREDFAARELARASPPPFGAIGATGGFDLGARALPLAAPPGPGYGLPGPTSGDTPRDLPRSAGGRDDQALDPFSRHHASLASPDSAFAPQGQPLAVAPGGAPSLSPPADAPVTRGAASLEDLLPALVRRVAFSGDGRRGTVRLELGAGHLAGATLLVHADGGRVRVQLDVPPGTDASGWQERIERRLHARGIVTDGVEVT
jgi:hypothetical protein